MEQPTGVLVADDHALFRDGLTSLIGRWTDFEVVAAAADGAEAIRLARRLHPRLVLMDVRMEPVGGVEATARICAEDPSVKVVMLTMSRLGEDVYQALRSGADGYVIKDEPAHRLHDYLAAVMRGETALSSALAAQVLAELTGSPVGHDAGPRVCDTLTPRELDVLRLLVDGLSNEEIARDLHLGETTVKKHLGRVMDKLHVRNRVQVAVYSVRQGLVP
ncbi:MAG: response regulator transcription factor [Micrococcales bacterium]|uniref:response regulator transcription factor n=1 Tax=Cellulomonas sp. P4 TaxID=3142533 RepID=UPI0019C6D0A3|nr:response regulator transcription factor [Micrococcales bacterium]